MLTIDTPVHGAVLNHRHGKQSNGSLDITVAGHAPLGDTVNVNGIPAHREGTHFSAPLSLTEKETDIVAISHGPSGNHEHNIRVRWDRNSRPRYRFSIDDNIFFLRDIAQNQYNSLFDCFYLAMLRNLNTQYGARFSVNIYFTTDHDFDLTQFPDRYKNEWQKNADWLKLAFHARADKPDRPYQYTSAQRLLTDWDQVNEQIHRFAGPETCAPPTVIHWGMVQPAVFPALYERGIRVLSSQVTLRNGLWDIHYLLDDTRSEHLSRHDALLDFDSGITFSRIDIVCNSTPLERIAHTLEPLYADPNHAEIMDLFTHEQYFWPFYQNHIPDHAQRLNAAIRWVTDHGYEPVFFHEGYLGVPD
ncbi:MAG: hypothetical protein O2954_13295 [bacterium]|nr:hypothetical protein [bacterium]